MNLAQRKAFTLIELLVVIAVIGVFAASSIAVLVAPARERVTAEEEHVLEAGAAMFFASLTADAHSSTTLVVHDSPPALLLGGAGPEATDVLYFVDAKRRLRRAVIPTSETQALLASRSDPPLKTRAALLLGSVEELKAQQDPASGLWQIQLRAGVSRINRTIAVDRQMALRVGHSWAGGHK